MIELALRIEITLVLAFPKVAVPLIKLGQKCIHDSSVLSVDYYSNFICNFYVRFVLQKVRQIFGTRVTMATPTVEFYYIPASPPARAVLLAAKTIGVKLECKLVNVMAGEHMKPEFLAVSVTLIYLKKSLLHFIVDYDLSIYFLFVFLDYIDEPTAYHPNDQRQRPHLVGEVRHGYYIVVNFPRQL